MSHDLTTWLHMWNRTDAANRKRQHCKLEILVDTFKLFRKMAAKNKQVNHFAFQIIDYFTIELVFLNLYIHIYCMIQDFQVILKLKYIGL